MEKYGFVYIWRDRKLMSDIITSKWEDLEYRKKMSEAHMGWKWFNNGSQSIKIVDGALVPLGFIRGRIKTW